jgi:hypothetical protein
MKVEVFITNVLNFFLKFFLRKTVEIKMKDILLRKERINYLTEHTIFIRIKNEYA